MMTHIRAASGGVTDRPSDAHGWLPRSSGPAAEAATPGRPAQPAHRGARNGPPWTAARVVTTPADTPSAGAPSW